MFLITLISLSLWFKKSKYNCVIINNLTTNPDWKKTICIIKQTIFTTFSQGMYILQHNCRTLTFICYFFQETSLCSSDFWAFWCWKFAFLHWMWPLLQREASRCHVLHGVEATGIHTNVLFIFKNSHVQISTIGQQYKCVCKYPFKFQLYVIL